MVVIDINGNIAFKELFDVGQAQGLPGINDHKFLDALPGNAARINKTVEMFIQFFKNAFETVFLGPWKKQERTGIEMPDGNHGRKGIKVRIGMAGDENAHGVSGCDGLSPSSTQLRG